MTGLKINTSFQKDLFLFEIALSRRKLQTLYKLINLMLIANVLSIISNTNSICDNNIRFCDTIIFTHVINIYFLFWSEVYFKKKYLQSYICLSVFVRIQILRFILKT